MDIPLTAFSLASTNSDLHFHKADRRSDPKRATRSQRHRRLPHLPSGSRSARRQISLCRHPRSGMFIAPHLLL